MFADDFVGLTTNAEDLQKLIDVVQEFCNKWRLKSNIEKSAFMVFSKEVVKGTCTWKWGDKEIPSVVSYCYLASLESIQLGAKKILGCSSKTCNEAVRGDMGLESLKARRDRCKLKWWYKVNNLDDERYPRLLLDNEWEVKPCRGRQRKAWRKVISDLLLQLNIDSQEILVEDYNVKLFLETALRNREYTDFNDGLNKVKLSLYKSFCKEVEFKITCRG